MYSFEELYSFQGNYILSRKLYSFKELSSFMENTFIQGNYIHSKKYIRLSKLYSFKEICSFKETIFIQQRCVPGHSRNIYSTSFPNHFVIIISFIIDFSWIKYGYHFALFDWRMTKLLMSRVPYYNLCACRLCYHCAKKYHLNRRPFPKVCLS